MSNHSNFKLPSEEIFNEMEKKGAAIDQGIANRFLSIHSLFDVVLCIMFCGIIWFYVITVWSMFIWFC